jgi:hypothetical protein
MEILTVAELAAMLKMSKRRVYEMTNERTRSGSMKDHPPPVLKNQRQLAVSQERC